MGKVLLAGQARCTPRLRTGRERRTTPEPLIFSGHAVPKAPSRQTGAGGPGTGTKLVSQEGWPPITQALPGPCPPYPAAGGIHCPGSVLEEAGAAAGHSEALGQAEAWAVHPGRSVWWVVGGEPETQAAKWTAAEVSEDPGPRVRTGSPGAPGRGEPCRNLREEDQSPNMAFPSDPPLTRGHFPDVKPGSTPTNPLPSWPQEEPFIQKATPMSLGHLTLGHCERGRQHQSFL